MPHLIAAALAEQKAAASGPTGFATHLRDPATTAGSRVFPQNLALDDETLLAIIFQ
jgi:hypothetical protein